MLRIRGFPGYANRPGFESAQEVQKKSWQLRKCPFGYPIVAKIYVLVQQLATMIRQRESSQLDNWLQTCLRSGVPCLKAFAKGIFQDYDAVRAALETEWSSGQAEGQINRLKLIKREMYGRAGFDLLRLRVLHPV